MAHSRLEKIGTIFSRITGLLRSGAMKANDKPLWYEVYEAFPPKLEPRYDRPAPNIPLRKIFYEEDKIRSKYHKDINFPETINLVEDVSIRKTNCQKFIEIYTNLHSQGALDEEKITETAKELLQERLKNSREAISLQSSEEPKEKFSSTLVNEFTEAKKQPVVDVKDIFKE